MIINRRARCAALAWLAGLLLVGAGARAHDGMNLDELAEAFGWDFETAVIKAQKVAEGTYVLFGVGGNIGVSIGSDGTLLVDDQFPQMMPKIKSALKNLGGEGVDFAVNTHWHFDHAEGNLTLGPEGTWIVAQENSREMMTADHVINLVLMQYEQKAYPEDALPVITYGDRMQFHFNDQTIELLHFGPAHTTGDTAVIFRGANAVHLGDVFNRGYPFIDADNGGDLSGMIAFCERVLAAIDESTVVIPGHGEISDYEGLRDYIDMLRTVRERITKLLDDGADLAAVAVAKPTADFDETYGDPTNFVDRAFTSLARERAAREPAPQAGAAAATD